MHQFHGAPARLAAAALFSAFALSAHASCGAAFCSVNTDWTSEATGLAEGSVFDVRYEHIRQDQPRAGSRRVGVGEIRKHHDEVRTLNRNLVGTFTHTFANGFGLSVSAPFMDRDHLHLHNHRGAVLREEWNFREWGDVRITGRYQRALAGSDAKPSAAGVILGRDGGRGASAGGGRDRIADEGSGQAGGEGFRPPRR